MFIEFLKLTVFALIVVTATFSVVTLSGLILAHGKHSFSNDDVTT